MSGELAEIIASGVTDYTDIVAKFNNISTSALMEYVRVQGEIHTDPDSCWSEMDRRLISAARFVIWHRSLINETYTDLQFFPRHMLDEEIARRNLRGDT